MHEYEFELGGIQWNFRRLVKDTDRITFREGLVTIFTWPVVGIWRRIPVVCSGCTAEHRIGLVFALGRVGFSTSIGREPCVRSAT
jgi:hypothetical protein